MTAPSRPLHRRSVLQGALAAPLLMRAAPATATPQGGRPLNLRIIQSGHSLTDPIVPMLDAMVAAIGGAEARGRVIDRSTIPGSPLEIRWNEPPTGLPDARHDIADYALVVLTERVSLANTKPWHASEDYALRWVRHAWEQGNGGAGAESVLYATWVDTDSGPGFDNPHNDPEGDIPFRDRLPLEMTRWQTILDHVNANLPDGAPPMRMIPGPLIMAAAYDAIAEDRAPGLTRIEDLFSDTIHVNAAGAYLIALAHLGVIYGRDPRDLPHGMGRTEVPPPETAAWMQSLVHDVLRAHPDTGYPPQG